MRHALLLFLLAGAAGLPAAPARAQLNELARAGDWVASGGTSAGGTPLCVASAVGQGRSLHIKYFAGQQGLYVQAFKQGWRIPQGTRVPVVIRIDNAPAWTATAGPTNDGDGIEWRILGELVGEFENLFRSGTRLALSFPSGSEAPWSASLRGSNQVADAFVRCMGALVRRDAPTQPHDGGGPPPRPEPTQPFGGGAPPTGSAPAPLPKTGLPRT